MMNNGKRLRTTNILAWRELKSTLYGAGFYILLTFALLVSSLVLRNYIQTIKANGLMISANPLNYPLYLAVLIGSIYLALASTITISREREEGTLQTLFFGPVDDISYLMAKYLQQMILFTIILAIFTIYFLLASLFVNFTFSANLLKMIILFIFLGSCIISFGIFLSTLTRKVKTAIILFIAVMVIFLGLQVADIFLSGIKPEDVSGVILYIRNAVGAINNVVRWISPFSYLNRGLQAARIDTLAAYGKNLLAAIAYSFVFLLLAKWSFQRKGVSK